MDVQKGICAVYLFFEKTCCTAMVIGCTINHLQCTGGVHYFIIYFCSLMSILVFCPLHLLIRLLFGWELLHWQFPVSHVASCATEWPPETDISLSFGHVQLPKTAALNVHTLLKLIHVNISAANKFENVLSCHCLWHFLFKRNINSVRKTW